MALLPNGQYNAEALAEGWYNTTEQQSKIYGFDSDIRQKVLSIMGVQYNLYLYSDYGLAAYLTRIGQCDINFAPVTMGPFYTACDSSDCPPLSGTDYTDSGCCLDFGQPHVTSNVGLLSKINKSASSSDLLTLVFSNNLINVMITTVAVLIASAHIVWALDRHVNSQFPRTYFEGIVAGVWWGAVTITTVGYGDKTPATKAAKAYGFFFLFVGFVLTAIFAGTLISNLTNNQITAYTALSINGLTGNTICTITDYHYILTSQPVQVIEENGDTLTDCVNDLRSGKAQAIFVDRPILEYALRINPDLAQMYTIIDQPYVPLRTASLFPKNSSLLRAYNNAVLTAMADFEWVAEVNNKWLSYSSAPLTVQMTVNWNLGIALLVYVIVFAVSWTVSLVYRKRVATAVATVSKGESALRSTLQNAKSEIDLLITFAEPPRMG